MLVVMNFHTSNCCFFRLYLGGISEMFRCKKHLFFHYFSTTRKYRKTSPPLRLLPTAIAVAAATATVATVAAAGATVAAASAVAAASVFVITCSSLIVKKLSVEQKKP
jgi:hypothetical protein